MSASGDPLAPAGTGEDGWSLLRAMFGASNVIAGVVEVLDDDFLYVAANAAACELFGLPDGEMQGKRGRDLGLSEAQIATRMETLRQRLATGEARLSDYAFETNGRPPRWLTGAFNRLPATRPLVSFVIVDLTERRNAEEQARIQAARLALAVEAAEIGIWEFDVATGAVTWDGRMRRMFGVFAAGRILNAKTARSQITGGMIWGVGSALTEGLPRPDPVCHHGARHPSRHHRAE